MLSHFVLIAIPTIVILFLYGTQLREIIFTDTISQEQALSTQTSLTLTSTIDQITRTSKTIQENAFVKDLNDLPLLPQSEIDALISDELTTLQQLINTQVEGDLITNIRIYVDGLPNSLYTTDNPSDIFAPISATDGTYWSGIFAGTTKTELYCPSFYLSSYEIENLGELAYIVEVSNEFSATSPIFIVVYFSQQELYSILSQNSSTNYSVAYIINERNSLVASSDATQVGTYIMEYEEIIDIALSSNTFITKEVLGESVYAGCYRISDSDWYMVSILPKSPLESKGLQLAMQFAILYLALLIIAFIIANALSHSITIRIKTLGIQMESIRGKRPTKMPTPVIKDEIGDLIESYNYMSNEMNMLLTQQVQSSERLRISEFEALQAQINPHFLYNTMDMINWLAQSGKNKEVTEAVQSLSSFYKLTLSKKSIITTIENEVEHVSLYVKLQNMRYENRIELIIDIPDELLQYEIPKLTFQPVVENAIQHGILEKESGSGSIVITGWAKCDTLIILISDDGIGIPPEKLPLILDGTVGSKHGSNIGIYNTHERLRTLYGKDCGLSYSSTLNKGTDVEIHIKFSDSEDD